MKCLFELGHQPDISVAEIFSVFSKKDLWCGIVEKNKDKLLLSAQEIDPKDFMKVLGGTVSIAKEVKVDSHDNIEAIANYLDRIQPEGKIDFAISGEGGKDMLMPVKNKLKEKDRSARFVKIKNTASIKYNNLAESGTYIKIYDGDLYAVQAIQPFEKMKNHDFERPAADPESGMLPPKLARIMVNLTEADTSAKLMDPFCGSGTVLMEAASMGFEYLVGNDLEEKAISDTKENLEWVKQEENLDFDYKLYNSPAESLSDTVQEKIDAVATEPYMGKPLQGNENEKFLKEQANKLRRLYIDTFYEFAEVLNQDATVIFIIPQFKHKDRWIKIDCIEQIKQAGFEVAPFEKQENLLYARDNQRVGRSIWKFKKK